LPKLLAKSFGVQLVAVGFAGRKPPLVNRLLVPVQAENLFRQVSTWWSVLDLEERG
jgi:hypothetical protein